VKPESNEVEWRRDFTEEEVGIHDTIQCLGYTGTAADIAAVMSHSDEATNGTSCCKWHVSNQKQFYQCITFIAAM